MPKANELDPIALQVVSYRNRQRNYWKCLLRKAEGLFFVEEQTY
jgi:hypothetical protein